MSTDKPLVAIIDWAQAPLSEPTGAVERSVLDDVAQVKSFLCNDDDDFTDEVFGAAALLIWHNARVNAAGIEKLRACRAIIRNGVGYDSVDIDAARRRGIPVCNVPDYGTEEVADHAIALTLALCRQLFSLDAEARKLEWRNPAPGKMHRLRGQVFGVIGLGRIGTAAALRAKALGFEVWFYDPYLPNGVDKAVGIHRDSSLEDLLRRADVLSIHCPLNDETNHLVGERELAAMKPTAFLVNTARGAIAGKSALFAALRAGRLAGAGLDVVEDEPLKSREEAATPNLIVTCHSAYYSGEAMTEMRTTSAGIARAAILGEPLQNVVNGVGG